MQQVEDEFDYDYNYDYDYKNLDKTANNNDNNDNNDNNATTPKDSNGTMLKEGDAVIIIKDLKVRGSSAIIKRGTKVKSIRLTDNLEEVEGKVEGAVMVLRVEFLKKA